MFILKIYYNTTNMNVDLQHIKSYVSYPESAIVRCPDIACLDVYIPPECAEPTYSTYGGQTCLSCPRNKCPDGYPVTDI